MVSLVFLVALLTVQATCENSMTLQSLLGGSSQNSSKPAEAATACTACLNNAANQLAQSDCDSAHHAYWSNGHCYCQVGYKTYGGKCVGLGDDLSYVAKIIDGGSQKVQSLAAKPQKKEGGEKKPVKIQNIVENQAPKVTEKTKTENQQKKVATTLICKENEYIQDGVCVPCSKSMIYNSISKKCICPKDQVINSDGICQVMSKISNSKSTSTDQRSLGVLQLFGAINSNSNNVMISLKTAPVFSFRDDSEMDSFIKAQFTDSVTPTVYCRQRESQKQIFDCLLIYPSGVPNKKYSVHFKFDSQGKMASTDVLVDPLQSAGTNSRKQRIA